jgi:hypothetical protein
LKGCFGLINIILLTKEMPEFIDVVCVSLIYVNLKKYYMKLQKFLCLKKSPTDFSDYTDLSIRLKKIMNFS